MTERRAWLGAVALAALALIGPACTEADLDVPSHEHEVNATYEDPRVMPVVSIDPEALQKLPLCSQLADGLRGKEATIYVVAGSGGLDAIDLDRHIVCVDAEELIAQIGIINVDAAEPLECDFCDGTPLPAASGTNQPLSN
jgi:hypothetical protein